MLRMDQVFYLTDFRTLGPAVLLVPRDRSTPRSIVTPRVGRRTSAAKRPASPTSAGIAPDELVRDRRRCRARAAATARALGPADHAGRHGGGASRLPRTDLADGGDDRSVGRGERARRRELERIERAGAIADEGFRALRETARVGMREYELAAEVEAAMHAAGAEDNFGLIAAGNAQRRDPAADRSPLGARRRDHRRDHAAAIAAIWRSSAARSSSASRPPCSATTYDLLVAALRRGCDVAKPGVPSADIARAVNDVIGGAGYAEYCRQPYMRTRGHGLGLGAVVPYDLNEDTGPVLESDMTMVIHPNQYIPETGYMMLGDTVVIEDDGPRALTRTPIRLYWRDA